MLDREIRIRFTLRQVFCRAWVPPVAVVVLFGACWWAVYWQWWCVDWPAWVQAIGSILAIISGFLVVKYQDGVREAKQLQESWAYMDKALYNAGNAITCLEHVRNDLRRKGYFGPFEFRGHARLLQGAIDDMALISFVLIEDNDVANSWVALKRCMTLANAAMLDAATTSPQIDADAIDGWVAEMHRMFTDMHGAVQRYAERHKIAQLK